MLRFQPLNHDVMPSVVALMQEQQYRTCDYSAGGLYMWTEYFDYTFCIRDDMLYIKCRVGGAEHFMLPVGRGSLEAAFGNLREYSSAHNIPLRLISVPDAALPLLPDGGNICPTRQWFDYLYSAADLATYKGHALKNKRNRANHFAAANTYRFERLTAENIALAAEFVERFATVKSGADYFRDYENRETLKVLEYWELMPFAGYLILVDSNVEGVIIGEVVIDTLFIHIEKANTAYSGINEVLTSFFVGEMMAENRSILYVNREEDMGDEGLRRSKLSYKPLRIIGKYSVEYEREVVATIIPCCGMNTPLRGR